MHPDRAPRNPHEHAMRMARMRVGQPPPMADKRFLVEAFWMTVTLRLTLVELAGTWLEALRSKPTYPPENYRVWATYIAFILRSCASDLQITLGITIQSGSHRQKAQTALLVMRIELEQFRFNLLMMQKNPNLKMTPENRKKLADNAEKKGNDASVNMQTVITEHRQARGVEDETWLSSNFSQQAHAMLDEWQAIVRSLRQETFYQPVSLDEMTAVVKGLGYGYTGHFYKCPNGHTFVIGDCGGAMEVSRCNECGEMIGGTGHQLLSANSRATQFEELGRAEGYLESPWPWAR